jgi:hypothetical protein
MVQGKFQPLPDFGHKSSLSAEAIMEDAKVTQIEVKGQDGFLASYRLSISYILQKKSNIRSLRPYQNKFTLFYR